MKEQRRLSDTTKIILVLGLLMVVSATLAGTLYDLKLSRCIALPDSEVHSRGFEELLIRDFFAERREGFFVDVGANHYMINSNTYYLEKELGWRGIAVDALPEFGPDYTRFRPNTRFFSFFVSDRSDETIDFYKSLVVHRLSSSSKQFAASKGEYEEIKVGTITLNDLLELVGVTGVDLVSMDIELAEPMALAGFSIEKYRPTLVCIEAHSPVRSEIMDYFSRHHYQLLKKYSEVDAVNLYFTPVNLR